MVTVRFYTAPDGALHLRVRGHAGAGERGHDLVCAGVSTLCRCLGRAAEHLASAGLLAEAPHIALGAGEAAIDARPLPAHRDAAALVFWTAQVGLNELACAYPENVTLEGVLRLEKEEETIG